MKSSSINSKELEKFDKISTQWWAEDKEFKILHQINPIRLSYISDKIKSHFRINTFTKLDILDIGCGGGLISEPLCRLGGKVTGIDALQNNINIAKEHAKKEQLNINYIRSTIEELPKNELYDVVLCLEVIEHIDNLQAFVKNLISRVKPNGMLIISTINRTIKAYLLAIITAEYILHWVSQKTHDYNKFLKPSEIYTLFNKRMNIKEFKGMVFDLVTQEWRLSNNIDVNYFAYMTKI